MDNMQYAEGLVREFLLFRGFKNTLQVFESELSSDISKNFQVEKITDLIFLVYVPKFEADKLVSLITFLRQCFSSSSETVLISTLTKMEASILRYYIVHALKCGRKDKVLEFFGTYGNVLLQRGDDWTQWFAIPYLKNPSLDPQFHVHFSKEWLDALLLSFKNFLSEIFNDTRIPALLKISTDNNTLKRLKKDIKQLNLKLLQLQASLERKDAQLCQLRSSATSTTEGNIFPRNGLTSDQSTGTSPSDVTKENSQLQYPRETNASDSVTQIKFQVPLQDASNPVNLSVMSTQVESGDYSSYLMKVPHGDGRSRDTVLMCQDDVFSGSQILTQHHLLHSVLNSVINFRLRLIDIFRDIRKYLRSWLGMIGSIKIMETSREELREEEFPEVKVGFQETFLGHTSPISRCRFSAGGTNIASASVDGTVRIWTYDSSTPTSRNATIYCGAEIMSLDWECKSDRLLLIGTADGGIKAWNVDAKRVVCDLNTTSSFPSVLDLKCSPVEPIFVSAAASRRYGSSKFDNMGFASLTVWNMKTWKAMTVLPLGKDPPAITSLCFNHNGKILAASATDGMIHMFDMAAGLQITGWPAHDSAVSSVQFGPDETSIFSFGSDGKIFEWSLQNQGQVLWSRDHSRFCCQEGMRDIRHEMALDSNGRRLLVTSASVRAPIYQVQGHMSGLRTLPHTAAITTVDWHPTLPIFLTGSADNSVRVTSIL